MKLQRTSKGNADLGFLFLEIWVSGLKLVSVKVKVKVSGCVKSVNVNPTSHVVHSGFLENKLLHICGYVSL